MRTWGSAAREAGAAQESIKAWFWGGGDQKHYSHPSCFCNSAHQHLGGATLWGSSPTPSHAKDRQMCRIDGRAENLIKSKEPHRSCKLLGLSKKIEVQGSDCGSIRVT